MKDIFPIILVIVILVLSITSKIAEKKHEPDYTLEMDKEYRRNAVTEDKYQGRVSEGNTENSGGASTIYVESLDLILEYLNPDAMIEYNNYMNVYTNSMLEIANRGKSFFDNNKDVIENVFGIYEYSDFEKLVNILKDAKIEADNEILHIRINSITQQGSLLDIDIDVFFTNGSINLKQLLSYIYIEGEPNMFIYTEV